MRTQSLCAMLAKPTLLTQSAVAARNIFLFVMLHQIYAQEYVVIEDEQEVVRKRPFVLSVENIAQRFQFAATWDTAMVVAEDFFAVRLPKFIAFWIVIAFGALLAYILPRAFEEILRRFQTPRHYRKAFRWPFIIALAIGTLWFALALVGIDFIGIALSLGAAAIFFSSGIGPTVSNTASGIDEQISGDLDIGTEISIANYHGYVEEMRLQKVKIRDFDNPADVVLIPNNYFSQYPLRVHGPRPVAANEAANNALNPYVVNKPKES
jgi:small-conductance mechanosensitive channel